MRDQKSMKFGSEAHFCSAQLSGFCLIYLSFDFLLASALICWMIVKKYIKSSFVYNA